MNLALVFGQLLIFLGFRPPLRPPVHPIVYPDGDGPVICATDDSNQDQDMFDDGDYNPPSDQWLSRCGLPINMTPMFNTKIIGGYNAKITEFPWQVSLQNNSMASRSSHFCGGSLIHPKWVVSAAHCLEWTLIGKKVRKDAIRRLRVIAGTQTLAQSANRLNVGVSNIMIHPMYETRTDVNDIALLELERPIDLSMRTTLPINTVCLPNDQDLVIHSNLITTGWGHTRENGYNSYNLKAVELPLISQRQCKRVYGRGFSMESMICAGEEGKDSCQGDSGGPLIQFDHKTGRATLVGIVSIGNGCGRKDFPGIYTKVSYYIDWISNAING